MTIKLITSILLAGIMATQGGCGPKTDTPANDSSVKSADRTSTADIEPSKPVAAGASAAPNQLPDGIDAAQTSGDPTYGYTRENPIRVGFADEYSGPRASRAYLNHLRDATFQPFEHERVGSFSGGPDDHMLDKYRLRSSTGETFEIFIDMYHPENTPLSQLAPKGMWFWK